MSTLGDQIGRSKQAMGNPTAFVLLDQPIKLDHFAMIESLKARHPDQKISMPPTDGRNGNTILVSISGVIVAIMQFDVTLPDGWQSAANQATIYWPESETVFRRHRAHLAVAALGDSEDRLQISRATAAVIGAFAVTHSACSGMLWDLAVANSSQIIEELSKSAFSPYPDFPSALWVSMNPFRDPDTRRVGVLTTGLRKFVGREIEFEAEATQLKSLLITTRELIAYLLQDGVSLKHGDTIGASANERIPVRYTESRRFKGLPVIAANLPAV